MMRLLLLLLLIPSIALADCFTEATPKPFPLRYKVHRGALGCDTFSCLVERSRTSRRFLRVYRTKRLKPKVLFSTLRINRKSVAVVRNQKQLEAAKLISAGVEIESLCDTSLIEGDLRFHYYLVDELTCERRNGKRYTVPREVVSLNNSLVK